MPEIHQPQAVVARQRHAKFYTAKGTDIFAVDDTLYRVHADLLGLQEGVLRDLFMLPQTEEGREGLTDERPIVLPQVTKAEFEHYLELIYEPLRLPPYSIQKLVDVLKISTQWETLEARKWAIHHLERMDNIPASLRLNLGRKFDIPHWVEPAFRDLVFIVPLSQLRGEDFTHLNYPVYILLSKLKEAIDSERRAIAYFPPTLSDGDHSPLCASRTRCGAFWREAWWLKIGRRLLDPDGAQALPLADAPNALRAMDWSGMTGACRDIAVQKACSGPVFGREAELLGQALKRLGELPVD